jgi:hypothetical protein
VKRTAAYRAAARPAWRWRAHLLALCCYSLGALLVTYPLPTRLGEQIVANGPGQVDGFLGVWNIWWGAQAVMQGRDPYVTPLLFYPQGLDLFWQTLSLPQGLLALPLTLALGPLPAYNLLILASFALGGYAAFLFCRHFVAHSGAALVGGAVYAFAPFHMQKVLDAQLEVAAIQWLPLALLAAHRLLAATAARERPLRLVGWALLSGLLLLWVGMGTWYYGLFALIYTGMAAGIWAICEGKRQTVKGKSRLALLPFDFYLFTWGLAPLLVWLTLMAPRLISLARSGDTLLGDARTDQYQNFADLVAFWLPNPNHPLWGQLVSDYYLRLYPDAFLWNVSLGLVGSALALVGLLSDWRRRWPWAALIIATALLALGSTLRAFGRDTGLPMPYALIEHLPGIRNSHRPNHVVLITILLTALLAAYGVQALAARWPRQGGPLVGGLLLAVLAIDGWAGPLPLYSRPIPSYYRTIGPPQGAILPVPLHLNFSNSENLWYQTVHGWPIVGGFIGRAPPYPLGDYAPGVREIRLGRYEPADILSPGWPELARESLAAYDVRYVMFHRQTMGSSLGRMGELVDQLGLRASYNDEQISVYPVLPPAEARPLAYLGAGWGEIERAEERRWRWMGASAQLYLLNPGDSPRSVRLTLDVESYERARPLSLRLGDGASATLEVSRARMQRTIHLLLPPGEHVLYLGAPADTAPGRAGQPISIAFLGIAIE